MRDQRQGKSEGHTRRSCTKDWQTQEDHKFITSVTTIESNAKTVNWISTYKQKIYLDVTRPGNS